jgi:hypothetical protein
LFELSGFSLIETNTFQGRHRTLVNTTGSVFENDTASITYDLFDITNAVYTPATESTMETLSEGLREKLVFELYTDTYLTTAVEDTQNYGDQIELDIGKGLQWFTVKKVYPYLVGGFLTNYKAIIVRED